MMNFLKRCVSGIEAGDFVPPVCGKLAGKFRNYFHLKPATKRTAHYQYLPTDYHPDFVIDIGAATGFTAYAALQSFETIPVYCIEPMEQNFTVLHKSISDFQNRAATYKMAISDRNGDMEINLTSSPYSNSLFELPEQYRKDNPDIKIIGRQKVHVETLDTFAQENGVEGSGLVKIDVEGAELDVLNGGREFLKSQVSAVIIELAFNRGVGRTNQIMERLLEYDFMLYNVFDVDHSESSGKSLVQMDAVYLKKQA